MSEIIPGFVPATVVRNNDELSLGRVTIRIEDLIEPESHFWVKPSGWPGAGGEGRGSQYPPPPIGAQIAVIFAFGRYDDPETDAIYLPGMYGLKDGEKVGPDAIYDAPNADAGNTRACIWEDDFFTAFVTNEENDHRFVIQTKKGSAIEINGQTGTGGNSEQITIDGRTGVEIVSSGLVDIRGSVVQIQGRRCIKGGGDW